ncbi:restriction endonuclease subunit S [Mariprofundus ferrooxydans]|uniref:HsdS protein n=1 Tax=Mariprofundus ferrooxydans PV-1 TaxID=314345 RepID=Q0EXK2_9PROT|nr:restriction endonuclease subunit S [Mariprofundus ferrooxydans]EAU54045.1 HsdS protein [Mariprofundus ferrooxydans PV-1]KON46602.1 hypothetical protein AL013_12485 [Mariprofundus ferrooxydans]
MPGKYPPYPEYKDSGVEWLGEIPAHWVLTRTKYISELTPKKPKISRDKECSFIPMEKLKTDSIVLDEVRTIDDVYDGYTYFADSDVLMAKVTPCFENKNIAIAQDLVNGVGFGSSEIYVIRANQRVSNRFLFYRLQEDSFMEIAIAAMTGAGGLKRVPSDVLNNYIAAVPQHDEQMEIANFLDRETAKIDTLIEKQQQLIKLLKEKRQAVISHAVTKGLNPDAPMRNSGIEWLGEVPAHWEISSLGFECSVKARLGWKGLKAEEYVDEGYIFLATPNIKGEKIDFENVNYITKARYDESPEIMLNEGDVLVTKDGSTTGTTNIVRELPSPATVNSSIAVLRSVGRIDSSYLYYFFVSTYVQNVIKRIQGGMGVPHLFQADLRKFNVLMPPFKEQKEIAAEIDMRLPKFDDLIAKAEYSILLMKERRTALISAAVTGKIDVRHHVSHPTGDLQSSKSAIHADL